MARLAGHDCLAPPPHTPAALGLLKEKTPTLAQFAACPTPPNSFALLLACMLLGGAMLPGAIMERGIAAAPMPENGHAAAGLYARIQLGSAAPRRTALQSLCLFGLISTRGAQNETPPEPECEVALVYSLRPLNLMLLRAVQTLGRGSSRACLRSPCPRAKHRVAASRLAQRPIGCP
jgi:hypothetical protein